MNCSGYYDEEGIYHFHNTNIVRSTFSCSNGHIWTAKIRHKCSACDWVQSHYVYDIKPDYSVDVTSGRELTDDELITWE